MRAATDAFKTDRDDLDRQSRQAWNEASNVEEEEEIGDEEMNGNESARLSNISSSVKTSSSLSSWAQTSSTDSLSLRRLRKFKIMKVVNH